LRLSRLDVTGRVWVSHGQSRIGMADWVGRGKARCVEV
jgi:hypothetical protein